MQNYHKHGKITVSVFGRGRNIHEEKMEYDSWRDMLCTWNFLLNICGWMAYAYKADSGLAHSIHNEDINIYVSAKKHSKDSIFIDLWRLGVVHRIYRL